LQPFAINSNLTTKTINIHPQLRNHSINLNPTLLYYQLALPPTAKSRNRKHFLQSMITLLAFIKKTLSRQIKFARTTITRTNPTGRTPQSALT
jgi:hypothetical protein